MAKQRPMGLLINGILKKSGVTFYLRNGQMVARSARSQQSKRRTRAQFVARQQLTHSCRLWKQLKWAGEPLFEKSPTAYARFRALMRRTPVVFTPCRGTMADAILLLPGMPVSDGVLPVVEQWLGELPSDGTAQAAELHGTTALFTSLTASDLHCGDILRLYTLRQTIESSRPMVRIAAEDLSADDFQTVDGRLALVGDEFADEMAGRALVHIRGPRCSCQQVVARCTYYQPFTTEEALLAAASYGGLTKEVS